MKQLILFVLLIIFICSVIICAVNLTVYEWVDNLSRRDLFIQHWDVFLSLLISVIGAHGCIIRLQACKRK